MICLAIGLGVLGFIAARKARRCCRAYHGYGWHHHHHHGWHHHHHHGWGGWGRRRGLYMALSHLDASPAQERAIVAEVDKLYERVHGAKRNLKDSRADLAAAVRAPELDDAALGAVLGRLDSAVAEVRSAALEALRNIHAVLDDRQREQLADLIDQGWWRRPGRGPAASGGGPYRV